MYYTINGVSYKELKNIFADSFIRYLRHIMIKFYI